ncbi:hypothetical protein MT021_004350 [Salmonella enterica]|nr:hypothetical protein [Salmonella enterica]EJL0229394.1 hypothetical protein [Salmonella enterica]HBR5657171.1 hypothetical protein [Klebsiella pneumoniae]
MSNITFNTQYSGMIILDHYHSGKTTFLNQITSEHPDLFFNMDDNYNNYTDSIMERAKANNQFLLASNRLLNEKEKKELLKKGFKILNSVEEAKDYYNNYLKPMKIAKIEQQEIEQVMNEKPVASKKKLRL